MNSKNKQLADAIVKVISRHSKNMDVFALWQSLTAAILPLINDRVKEAAGEAWDAATRFHLSIISNPPDRATYIDNLNK